jgi:hypothetical protein
MGYFAQLRQFFLDVRHHAECRERYEAGRPGARPPLDPDLDAGLSLANRELRLLCEADSAQDIRRWIGLADELGLEIGIVGGREAWKVADLLEERGIPLVLTLDWGDEPKDPHEKDKKDKAKKPAPAAPDAAAAVDAAAKSTAPEVPAKDAQEPAAKLEAPAPAAKDEKVDPKKKWEYEEPLGVREERRRLWEEGRDCAARLAERGLPFAFGSAAGTGADLLKKVRTLVEHGLSPEAALAGLTADAAALVGADEHLGVLRPGADASLALWTAHPTSKDAKLAWLFVDGFPFEFAVDEQEKATGKPDEGVDASGTWSVEIKSDQGTRPGTLELSMEPDGDVAGKVTTTTTPGGDERVVELTGHLGGKTMTLEGTSTARGNDITQRWKVELDGDAFSGSVTTKGPWGESSSDVTGTRTPKRIEREEVQDHQGSCGDDHP